MAFIDSMTFDIYSEIESISEIYSRSFQCDDLIAPIISVLNKKGYRTKACCSGHPYEGRNFVYSVSERLPYNETFSCVEINEGDLEGDYPEFRDFMSKFYKAGKKVFRHLVKTTPYEAYILFDKKYFLEDVFLPIGWFVEDNAIRYTFDHKQDPYYFMTTQVAAFMALYDWVQKLPYLPKNSK